MFNEEDVQQALEDWLGVSRINFEMLEWTCKKYFSEYHREVLNLRFNEKLSVCKIGARLNRADVTIMTLLKRLKEKLLILEPLYTKCDAEVDVFDYFVYYYDDFISKTDYQMLQVHGFERFSRLKRDDMVLLRQILTQRACRCLKSVLESYGKGLVSPARVTAEYPNNIAGLVGIPLGDINLRKLRDVIDELDTLGKTKLKMYGYYRFEKYKTFDEIAAIIGANNREVVRISINKFIDYLKQNRYKYDRAFKKGDISLLKEDLGFGYTYLFGEPVLRKLKENKMNTLMDVVSKSEEYLLSLDAMSNVKVTRVKDSLQELGFKLGVIVGDDFKAIKEMLVDLKEMALGDLDRLLGTWKFKDGTIAFVDNKIIIERTDEFILEYNCETGEIDSLTGITDGGLNECWLRKKVDRLKDKLAKDIMVFRLGGTGFFTSSTR